MFGQSQNLEGSNEPSKRVCLKIEIHKMYEIHCLKIEIHA